MAETAIDPTEANPEPVDSVDMDVVVEEDSAAIGGAKRTREVDVEEEEDEGSGDVSKKQKVEESVEERRLEKLEGEPEEEEAGRVKLGPKSFGSSVEMFDYFFNFLHYWPPNLHVNKYEQMVLLDLLKKGHAEPEKKIGVGIQAFQVRTHPMWKSLCFFLIRDDDSVDDFSFRKCIDNILPLPENMKAKSNANRSLGGGGGGKGHGGKGGSGGRGRGRGRGGKYRS